MTNQEAIEELKARKEHYEMGDCTEELLEAFEIGIKAIEDRVSTIDELEDIKEEVIRDSYMMFDYSKERCVITVDELCKIIHRRIYKLKGKKK